MAESGRNCVQCGRPIAMFLGITINGTAYHAHCWDLGGEPVMPVVESLQLGETAGGLGAGFHARWTAVRVRAAGSQGRRGG
jgi:hypothetical protein